MIRGKGVVVSWVPVLGQNYMLEGAGDAMDDRHHLLAARHCEGASIAELILHVNHQQNIPICKVEIHA